MANLIANQEPEVIGWSLPSFGWVKKLGTASSKAALTAVRSATPSRPSASQMQAVYQRVYKAALTAINVNGNKVAGGAFINVIPALKQNEVLWGKVHAMKSKISAAQYNAAAARIVAIRQQGATVYATDAKVHAGIMNKWAKSTDLPGLTAAITTYSNWMAFMITNFISGGEARYKTPYTKDLKTAKDAYHLINASWQAMNVNFEASKAKVAAATANIESHQMELLDVLGLSVDDDLGVVMETFNSKYADTPKKISKYQNYLKALNLSVKSPFSDLIGPMVEYIKEQKKKTFKNIAIGAAVVAAGGAALALT